MATPKVAARAAHTQPHQIDPAIERRVRHLREVGDPLLTDSLLALPESLEQSGHWQPMKALMALSDILLSHANSDIAAAKGGSARRQLSVDAEGMACLINCITDDMQTMRSPCLIDTAIVLRDAHEQLANDLDS